MHSTPTEALLDVNVLIALIFADHEHHLKVEDFVLGLNRFYTSPTTQGGFLRFATRPWKDSEKVEQPPRLTMTAAKEKIVGLANHPCHAFLIDDLPFTDLGMRSMQGHRQWTDAYLLNLAQKHHLSFASLESRMANLDSQTKPALFVVK